MSATVTNSSLADCVLKTSRAYFAEDLILLPLLLVASGRQPGSFVEIGAFDGLAFSNTFMLERCLAWRGELIEASSRNFQKLLRSGRTAHFIRSAVCAGVGTVNMTTKGVYPFVNGVPSEMALTFAERWHPGERMGRVETVPCESLTRLIHRARGPHGERSTTFLSIDVEGGEETVLANADISSFKVVMVETDGTNRVKEATIHSRLLASGLIKSRVRVRGSRVYVKPELDAALPHPPRSCASLPLWHKSSCVTATVRTFLSTYQIAGAEHGLGLA